ncbi:MAG: hypothetical protein AB7V23_10700, partial [Candidatus Nanopelagicales bacterium]
MPAKTRAPKTAAKTAAKRTVSSSADAPFTVPGMTVDDGHEVARLLQGRLHALNDVALTLKHVH